MARRYTEDEILQLKESVKSNPETVELDLGRVRESLRSSNDTVRANAAFVVARLARNGYRDEVCSLHELLRELLSSNHERTRLNAAWALSYITSEYPDLTRAAVPDFMNLLTDQNPKTRRAAIKALSKLSDTYKGDVHLGVEAQLQILEQNLKESVIVLGSYEDEQKSELESLCAQLASKGYDAHLIDEVPEHPMMSLQEKVRYWTSAARFCVMVDRSASGHVYEHQLVKEQRTILALFRPKRSGSTRMFGDEPLVDYKFIETFRFTQDPVEKLDEAIEWAEDIVDKRIEAYNELYEWREEE